MEFAVLGPLEVTADGRALALGGAKQRTMLATLLSHANQPVSRDALVEALWGDCPPRTASDNLRLYASRLRQVLGADRIVRRSGAYVIVVKAGELDLDRFRTLANHGRTALRHGDHRAAADTLKQALGLWRGTAYAELDRPGESFRLDELRMTALENRIEADLALGRHTELVPELLGHIASHPLRERLRGYLMLALARTGRQAEALSVYTDARHMLADELGVEPGVELQRIHLGILRGESRALAQLPLDIPDFVGRDSHIKHLIGHLRNVRSMTLAVIAGMGGVGKTTLAVHVAHRLVEHFPDGQLYVNLNGVQAVPSDPAQVLRGFLTALGVPGASVPESLDERAGLFRSRLARRRILILLDNAASEQQLRWLLPGDPGCAVIVTSRSRLTGLEGAHAIDLDVLNPADATRLFSSVVGTEQASAETAAVAEIVRLCGQMPLAVRIAGARLVARPHGRIDWLAERLRDERRRLDQLVAGDQAVRASLSLSYVALHGRARLMFRLLGLLECPDFAAWVAAALLDCSPEEGEKLLDDLVDTQLLTVFGTDSGGNLRYRFHDLVRLFARERADDEDPSREREEAITRALGAWLSLAEQAMEHVPGPCYAVIHGSAQRWPLPQSTARRYLREPMSWFDDERAALITAVRQACTMSLDELAWDLACCLERYFDVRGFFDDCRRVNEQAMELCRESGNRLGEAVMLRGLLDVTTWTGSGHKGGAMVALRTNAERLVEMFDEIGERRGLSDAHVMRAWGLAALGSPEAALEEARTALRLAGETGHTAGQARAHVAMAVAYSELRIETSIIHLTEALHLASAMGNPRFEATVLQFLGLAHTDAGTFDTAHSCLKRSLTICRSSADPSSETMTFVALAKLYSRQNDPRARPAAETAETLSRQYNLAHHLADSLSTLGSLDLAQGDLTQAISRLKESVGLWRARGWSAFLSRTLLTLAQAHEAAGEGAEAAACRGEALAAASPYS